MQLVPLSVYVDGVVCDGELPLKTSGDNFMSPRPETTLLAVARHQFAQHLHNSLKSVDTYHIQNPKFFQYLRDAGGEMKRKVLTDILVNMCYPPFPHLH
jgi:hypothetical protein